MPQLPARISSKFTKDDLSSCWEWHAAVCEKGRAVYGLVHYEGKIRMAHRVIYELLVGPIPEGLQLDHLCQNGRCVNPEHLEPVTSKENHLRRFYPVGKRVKVDPLLDELRNS